jgi:hypothetical protein
MPVIEPTSWPSIKTTYNGSLRAKIDTVYHVPPRAGDPPKATVILMIDYWIARLNEDKSCINQGIPLVPYP